MKTVLMDFDGTVADTLPVECHAFRETFVRFARRHCTDEEIIGMFGPTEIPIIRAVVPSGRQDAAIEHFYALYDQGHDAIRHPAMEVMLARLHQAGVRLGVVTGKGRRSALISLQRLGLDRYFPVVITGDDVSRPKPDPEGILLAMRQLGAEPGNTMYVGDSSADIRAARAAGVTAVGVQWFSVTQAKGAFDPAPDHHFTDPAAFADWLLKNR